MGNKPAIVWENGEGMPRRVLKMFAAALKSSGVRRADRVTIYMPMVLEAAIAVRRAQLQS